MVSKVRVTIHHWHPLLGQSPLSRPGASYLTWGVAPACEQVWGGLSPSADIPDAKKSSNQGLECASVFLRIETSCVLSPHLLMNVRLAEEILGYITQYSGVNCALIFQLMEELCSVQ